MTSIRRIYRCIAGGLVAALLAVPGPALGAITATNDAGAIVGSIAQTPGVVTGASFVAVPPVGTPNGIADAPLAGFPTAGHTFGILTTGNVDLADDLNTAPNSGVGDSGESVRGTTDFDVSILRVDLDVPAGANCLSISFRFLSDEFREYVGTQYNDAFVAELDASTWTTAGSAIDAPDNFAFDPNHNVISINAAGVTSMSEEEAVGTTYDGATPVLTASKAITPGAHSLFLSIFDQGDHVYDSAVFLDGIVVGATTDGACKPGATVLAMTKIADATISVAGAVNRYTISVQNPGNVPAVLSSISDTLPAGFAYVPGSTVGVTNGDPSITGDELVWHGPFTLEAGGTAALRFGVTVASEPGQYFNNASAIAVGAAVNPTGPTAPVTVVAELFCELDSNGPCNDGNVCTTGDHCVGDTCVGDPICNGVSGTVYLTTADPLNAVGGALVQACNTLTNACKLDLTEPDGSFQVDDLADGSYVVTAFPPSDGASLPASVGPITVPSAFGQDLALVLPQVALPTGDPIVGPSVSGGVPIVYWKDPFDVSVSACPRDVHVQQVCEVEFLDDAPEQTPLAPDLIVQAVENPVGRYTCSIPALRPYTGYVQVLFRITCTEFVSPPFMSIPVDVYIDPSGVVRTVTGELIAGATTTLLRSDDADGPFTAVPDGSAIMSLANRKNPAVTTELGRFGWDVVAGFYKVRAEKTGCVSPTDPQQAFVESGVLTIPPPVTDLDLRLSCNAGCGDGAVDQPAEQCDDGNTLSGDGCSSLCMLEENCSDLADNDADGLADCRDGDCAACTPMVRMRGSLHGLHRPGADRFTFRAHLQPTSAIDFGHAAFGVLVGDPHGAVFRADLAPGALVARGGRRHRFHDSGAASSGGLREVEVTKLADGTVDVDVTAYADFSAATSPEMTVVLRFGDEEFAVAERWKRETYGWLLP